ncbi:MAG: patatin-like phospholipase family protein [Candidatus Methylomirabilales bacterium]
MNFHHVPALIKSPSRFSVVLSGGLARGAAHLGVWRALSEGQLVPERVVGVSIGAMVGAYLCKEGSRGEALGILKELVAQALQNETKVKEGNLWDTWRLISLARRRAFIEEALGLRGLTFSQLPLPLYITATRLLPPGRVVFGDQPTDSVVEAILASTAVPSHPPVRVGDHYYLDGGMSGNLPVKEAVERGGRVILAVNLGPPMRRTSGPLGDVLWRFCQNVSRLPSLWEVQRCKAQGATVFQVSSSAIESYGMFAFDRLDTIEEAGYKATQRVLPALHKALVRLGEEHTSSAAS